MKPAVQHATKRTCARILRFPLIEPHELIDQVRKNNFSAMLLRSYEFDHLVAAINTEGRRAEGEDDGRLVLETRGGQLWVLPGNVCALYASADVSKDELPPWPTPVIRATGELSQADTENILDRVNDDLFNSDPDPDFNEAYLLLERVRMDWPEDTPWYFEAVRELAKGGPPDEDGGCA